MTSNIRILLLTIILSLTAISCKSEQSNNSIKVGAEQIDLYRNLLNGKNVAVMVNQTSMVNNIHLVDYLIDQNISIRKIFAVEHGFRGEAANGEEFDNSKDAKTGLPIVSLYGKKKKASSDDLEDIDVVIFDIQDVGCRFYTYISSLFYLMEACAENNKQLLILDRPNPNGDYVAGAVLDSTLKSFVGLLPIPVVHGCTVGELALMINGERWLIDSLTCDLKVIPTKNYTHLTQYSLPIKPSPNLPNDLSIRLYPSLCFFEATNISIGRGTTFPFQVIGFPNNEKGNFQFKPTTIPGVSTNPLHENKECIGNDLRNLDKVPAFTLKYFIDYFNLFEKPENFWKSERWIDLLSGDPDFYEKINNHWTEAQIIESWSNELNQYKQIRKKYLLYPDFE